MQTLPVERGKGVDQAGVRAAQARLKAGDWVHIFPEGTRSRDGKMGLIRRGIGHIVSTCSTQPLGTMYILSWLKQCYPLPLPNKSISM